MAVTIVPSVTDGPSVTEYPSVTEFSSVTAGSISGPSGGLLLMSGSFLLLMNTNILGLV